MAPCVGLNAGLRGRPAPRDAPTLSRPGSPARREEARGNAPRRQGDRACRTGARPPQPRLSRARAGRQRCRRVAKPRRRVAGASRERM